MLRQACAAFFFLENHTLQVEYSCGAGRTRLGLLCIQTAVVVKRAKSQNKLHVFVNYFTVSLWGVFLFSNFGGFWVLSITLKIRKFRSRNKWNALIRVEILRSKWSTTPEVVTGRSVRQPKLTVPFPKILVSSPASVISKQNFGRNANGSLRFNWKLCFNRTISFHFLDNGEL